MVAVMLVVIGGGHFGTYHARQLRKGVAAGRVAGPITVVDRDPECQASRELGSVAGVRVEQATWGEFLRSWLRSAAPDDHLVPAPLAPHLLWEWLADELGAGRMAPPLGWGLPYELADPSGAVFLSAAAWECPATCVEPAHCPALHAPRDWDLGDLLEQGARARGLEPAVFRCLHLACGAGSVRAGDLLAARERLRARRTGALVATTSRCHAAVGALAPSVG
jgi:hypothetical protein